MALALFRNLLEAEEWRYSVAPIPPDKLNAIMLAANNDPELLNLDDNILPPCNNSESEVDEDDETAYFEEEVEATFLTAVQEDVEKGNVIVTPVGHVSQTGPS